jgi:hypothetical protein
MNAERLSILQHALGCDQYGRGAYRNAYHADPYADLTWLVENGLMEDHGLQAISGMHFYTATQLGTLAMREASPVPPKLSASQRRYREWLSADCGFSFGEWIRRGQ